METNQIVNQQRTYLDFWRLLNLLRNMNNILLLKAREINNLRISRHKTQYKIIMATHKITIWFTIWVEEINQEEAKEIIKALRHSLIHHLTTNYPRTLWQEFKWKGRTLKMDGPYLIIKCMIHKDKLDYFNNLKHHLYWLKKQMSHTR
jgi:hypothetical protein